MVWMNKTVLQNVNVKIYVIQMQSSTQKSRKAVLLFFCASVLESGNQESHLIIIYDRNRHRSCLLSKFDINHEKTTDDETQVLVYTICPRCGHAVKKQPKIPMYQISQFLNQVGIFLIYYLSQGK